jgi:hypothetical protein
MRGEEVVKTRTEGKNSGEWRKKGELRRRDRERIRG